MKNAHDSVNPPELVIVLGMGRSGTSALAEVLSRVGFSLSPEDSLIGPEPSNIRGHFEDRRVVEVNDWILRRHGARWDNPWPLRTAVPTPDEINYVKQFWDSELTRGVRLVKDPRFCLTLPWWRPAWPSGVAFVHIHRHPTQVAESLWTRDSMPNALAELLWHEYVTQALIATKGDSRFFVQHRALIDDPAGTVEALTKALGAASKPGAQPAIAYSVIDGGLTHHVSTTSPQLDVVRSLWDTVADFDLASGTLTVDLRPVPQDMAVLGETIAQVYAAAAKAERAVNAMSSSRSWRWTGPLRSLTAGARPSSSGRRARQQVADSLDAK